MLKLFITKKVLGRNALVCFYENGDESVIEFYKTMEQAQAGADKLNKHYIDKYHAEANNLNDKEALN